MSVLINPVANAPVRSAAGGMLPGVLILKRVADAVRILQQQAGDELGRRRSDLLRQPLKLTLSTRPDVEIPASWHARSRGADVAEQVSEAAPKLGLIQARAFLALPRLLT
jgi:hypothetical protein